MKAMAFFGLAGLCGLALVGSVACGGSPSSEQSGSISDSRAGSLTMVSAEARTEAELPACRSENAGARALVASVGALQECTGGRWTAIASASGGKEVAYDTSTGTLSAHSEDVSVGTARWVPIASPQDPTAAIGSAPNRALFDAVGRDSSNWEIQTTDNASAVSPGAATENAARAGTATTESAIGGGGGDGCPNRPACTNVGEFGGTCFYLCNKVGYFP